MDSLMQEELAHIEKAYTLIVEFAINYGFQVIGAILVLIVGFWLAGYLSRWFIRWGELKQLDIALVRFIGSILRILVLGCFVIIALGKFGVSIAPFVAAVGAVGLGAGLAVQGLLSNYAAGMAIILSRTFKVGDTIHVQGVFGQVKDIRLALTLLETEDGEEITLPNRHVVGEILHNSFASRLVESEFRVGYEEDVDVLLASVRQLLTKQPALLQEPAPMVGIERFDETAIVLMVRAWVPTDQFYQHKFSLNQQIYQLLQREKVAVPYPQALLTMKK